MSTRKYFGTDGIRGRANTTPMTAETALKLGMAAGRQFVRGDHRHTVVIGKDTRLSGYMLEPALTAGFTAVGMDVILVGPMPTPAIAMLTKSLRADLGVMLSASHNPYHDNGIKLFGPDGYKLSDALEAEIEARMDSDLSDQRAGSEDLGRARRLDDVLGRYIEFVKATFPAGQRLDGLKVVVDCANGAAYKAAPAVLWELGADVIPLGVSPNGFNINEGCGSQHTATLQEAVTVHGAHIGLALDGDADRLIVCDEQGTIIDGDQILGLIGTSWAAAGVLTGGAVVATVMSNLGLERYLETKGLGLTRSKVGDRYVLEAMQAGGCNLGGEQSGHIILRDHATTGDGLMAGLQVLAAVTGAGRPASEVLKVFEPVPQLLKNVSLPRPEDMDTSLADARVAAAIEQGEKSFNGSGRVLIRKSGTEPVIRVMAEGDDEALVTKVVDDIIDAIKTTV